MSKTNRSFEKDVASCYDYYKANKKLLFYPSLAIISIIFSDPISRFLIGLELDKFIDRTEVNIILTLSLLTILIISIGVLYMRRIYFNHRINSSMQFWFWISWSLSLGYYHIAVPNIVFFPLDGHLKYLYAVYIYTAAYSLAYFIPKKNKGSVQPTSLFVAEDDLSIIFPNQETSPRKNLAKKIAPNIIHINTGQAFALAITGEWGSGKTTFIKHIKDELEENDRAIIIPFSPWKNKGEEAVIADFFYSLKKSLSPYNEQLAPEISNYLNSLLNISTAIPAAGVSKVGKLGLQTLKLLSPKIEGTEESYQKLAKAIESIEEPIVVIIDDLDRLDAGEVVAVLKLIRNVANFKGITFIVAYSKAYVENAIQKALSDYNSKYFLEKIVQKEVILPKLDHEYLFEVLKSLLTNSKSLKKVIKAEENKDWLNANNETLWFYLKTPRDIVRFYNSIILDFIEMGEYIDNRDFFYLYLIRLKYYEVYEMLWTGRDDIFIMAQHTNRLFLKKESDNKTFVLEKIISSEDIATSILSTLKVLLDAKDPISTDNDSTINALLSKEETKTNKRKRFFIKENFDLLYQIFIKNISHIIARTFKYINNVDDNFITEVTSFPEEKKNLLKAKLNIILKDDVIHSIQSKSHLSRCLHLYFKLQVDQGLVNSTLWDEELQQRVTRSTKTKAFHSLLEEVLRKEEFEAKNSAIILLKAISSNRNENRDLNLVLFQHGYKQFKSFLEETLKLEEINHDIVHTFRVGVSLFEKNSFFYDKDEYPLKKITKNVLAKFFSFFIRDLIHIECKSHLQGFFLNWLTLFLFSDINDFEKTVDEAFLKNTKSKQYRTLKEFIAAYKYQISYGGKLKDTPIMHSNLGRHLFKDLDTPPIIYGEGTDIKEFITKINNHGNKIDIQKLYLKHAGKLEHSYNILLGTPSIVIKLNKSKMLPTHQLYIAIPDSIEVESQHLSFTLDVGDYSTTEIDIDNIKLEEGHKLNFKYKIYSYNSAGIYTLEIS